MFRVSNDNLPNHSKKIRLQPGFLIWDGEKKGTGPLLRVNIYANWWDNPGWQNEILNLDSPISIGEYCRVDLNIVPINVKIYGYQQSNSAVTALSDNFWLDGQIIHLYKVSNIPNEIEIAFSSSDFTLVGNNYVFSLPENFTVNSATSLGINFDFTQTSESITLISSNVQRLDLNQSVVFSGVLSDFNVENRLSIATFYLDLVYLDAIAWLGKEFAPVSDLANIGNLNFIWDGQSQTVKLFVNSDLMPNYEQLDSEFDLSGQGNITYLR